MRLKVGDVLLDQFENTIIAQTYETNNFGDISTRRGGFSNDFTLPLTSKNDAALGFPSDINISNRNPYEKVDAQLIDKGAVISIGYLRYKIVQDKTIQCSFFSENTEWFNLIKDKKLTDLDLSGYDHDWTATNIANSFTNTDGYIYPVIDYGYFKDASIDVGVNQTETSDFQYFPAMYVKTIVEQIFKDIGWNVSGELLSEERYERMIQPFSAEDFVKPDSVVSDFTESFIEDGTGTVDPVPPIPKEVVWQGGVTDLFVSNETIYNANISLKLNSDIDAFETVIRIDKNGVFLDSKTFNNLSGDFIISNVFENIPMTLADYITFRISKTDAAPDVEVLSGTCELIPVKEYVTGDNINMYSTMPDITQADFLKYIFFSFGVVPQPNNYSKTVSLDFFESIADNVPNAFDWSKKLDASKSISTDFTQLLNGYSRVSVINYKDDEDDNELTAYKSETTTTLGQGQINIENEHLDPQKEVYTSPYTPMININSFQGTVNIPQIRWFTYNEDDMEFEKDITPKPKIALISDTIPWSNLTLGESSLITILSTSGGSNQARSEIPFCWFVKTQYIDQVDSYEFNLAYDPALIQNSSDTTLKETYIDDFESVLNNMKYVKAYFKLNEVDIINLDFLTPVYIDRFKAYFYINKVSNYQSNRSTEVELIKIGGNG